MFPLLRALWVGRRQVDDDWPVRPSPGGPFVFIHINKTGGTSIGRALGLPCKQHLTVQDVIARVGRPAWDGAYRFAVVRNPWDKFVSQYKHRVRTNQTGMGDQPIPFRDWVAATIGPDQRPPFYDNPTMFLPQVQWLRDADGRIDLDLVGRFENLAGAYQQVAARLGVTAALGHLNATAPSDYRSVYDDQSAEWVAQWFAEDLAHFGYRFDPAPRAAG